MFPSAIWGKHTESDEEEPLEGGERRKSSRWGIRGERVVNLSRLRKESRLTSEYFMLCYWERASASAELSEVQFIYYYRGSLRMFRWKKLWDLPSRWEMWCFYGRNLCYSAPHDSFIETKSAQSVTFKLSVASISHILWLTSWFQDQKREEQ